MKYAGAKLRQMLAAEYVLGTLHGRARARFARLLAQDAGLRREVTYWEQRLAGLAGTIAPVTPREVVWAAIDRAINANTVSALPQRGAGTLAFWRGWAAVSTAAALLLGVGLWQQSQRVPEVVTVQAPARPLPYVAMLQPEKSEAHWKVSLYPDRGIMKVAATGQYAKPSDRDLELWLIEAKGPRSLGLLPATGTAEMRLPREAVLQGELTLAISVEPRGGSPTGLPTGPVILAAPASQAL